MSTPRSHWSNWANQLHRLHLDSIAAWALEAGAPVALLGAQALFVTRPFLGAHSEIVANMLENEEETRAFAAYLREGAAT